MRRRIIHFWLKCRPALAVFALSCFLAASGAFIALTLLDRSEDNAKGVKTAQKDVKTAKKRATAAQKKTDDAQDTASAADRRSKRVVQYLQGKRGLPGVPGKNGKIGARGPAGVPGPVGPAGRNGRDGADAQITRSDLLELLNTYCSVHNCRGPQGATGPAGATGPQGATGPAGPPGPAMQRDFSVSFPRSDGSVETLNCSDPEGDGSYYCAPPASAP